LTEQIRLLIFPHKLDGIKSNSICKKNKKIIFLQNSDKKGTVLANSDKLIQIYKLKDLIKNLLYKYENFK